MDTLPNLTKQVNKIIRDPLQKHLHQHCGQQLQQQLHCAAQDLHLGQAAQADEGLQCLHAAQAADKGLSLPHAAQAYEGLLPLHAAPAGLHLPQAAQAHVQPLYAAPAADEGPQEGDITSIKRSKQTGVQGEQRMMQAMAER